MLTAFEANKIAKEKQLVWHEMWEKEINELIKKTSERGYTSTIYHDWINDAMIKELQDKGYDVSVNRSPIGEPMVYINWGF